MSKTNANLLRQLEFEIDQADRQATIERQMAAKSDAQVHYLFTQWQEVADDTEATLSQMLNHFRLRRRNGRT